VSLRGDRLAEAGLLATAAFTAVQAVHNLMPAPAEVAGASPAAPGALRPAQFAGAVAVLAIGGAASIALRSWRPLLLAAAVGALTLAAYEWLLHRT